MFHDQAWMIEHYATYVLHLERALADIEETLSIMNPLLASNNKRVKSKDKEYVKEQKILAKVIMVCHFSGCSAYVHFGIFTDFIYSS